MLIDDLHFKIDNRAVIQGNFNIQNKGFGINCASEFNRICDLG